MKKYVMVIEEVFDSVYMIIPLQVSSNDCEYRYGYNILFEKHNNPTKLKYTSKEVSKTFYKFFKGKV